MAKRRMADVQETLNNTRSVLHNLILTKGWDYVTFTTLSKASGMSRTGIVHHFNSREGLYQWMIPQMLDQLILEIESVGICNTNPKLINFFFRGCLDYGCDALENNFNHIEVGHMLYHLIKKHPSNN